MGMKVRYYMIISLSFIWLIGAMEHATTPLKNPTKEDIEQINIRIEKLAKLHKRMEFEVIQPATYDFELTELKKYVTQFNWSCYKPADERSPLHTAAAFNQSDVIALLYRLKFPCTIIDASDQEPIDSAIKNTNLDAVCTLACYACNREWAIAVLSRYATVLPRAKKREHSHSAHNSAYLIRVILEALSKNEQHFQGSKFFRTFQERYPYLVCR
jgi:hypothetical protein